MIVWKVTYDRDWGTRGERRRYTILFGSNPTPSAIEQAFHRIHGLYIPKQWQQPSCSGMIVIKKEEVLP